jgi:hypothetical protein
MSQDFFPKNRESIPGTASNLTEEQFSGALQGVGRETPMKNPDRLPSRGGSRGVKRKLRNTTILNVQKREAKKKERQARDRL